jgi:hypothetical protein
MLPYELTASFLLMADAPGVPKPIKLQEQHRPFVPLDQPITEETGRLLAEWAAGGSAPEPVVPDHEWADEADVKDALELAAQVGEEAHDKLVTGLASQRDKYEGRVRADWLARQVKGLSDKLKVTA